MNLALCGYPPLAQQLQAGLQGVEFKYFIGDFITTRGWGFNLNISSITFFEFRRFVNAGELDGVIIADDSRSSFTKEVVRLCKLYGIPKVGILNYNPLPFICWLDVYKIYLPYLEADLIDKCNLKCAACYHFANFSVTENFYPLEDFRRDIKRVSQMCDIMQFRLMGGEPLLLKNLDEYVKFLRSCLPDADLRILTNGLLIPSLPRKILDAISENKFSFDISTYPPTKKLLEQITDIAKANGIYCSFSAQVEMFHVFLTLNAKNNPNHSRGICGNEICRTIRKGKIYKCPLDAFSYKFAEKFKLKNYPASTGVDIYSPNFSLLLERLDGNIEMCNYCGEQVRKIPWTPTNNPRLEDWLLNPDEIRALQ